MAIPALAEQAAALHLVGGVEARLIRQVPVLTTDLSASPAKKPRP